MSYRKPVLGFVLAVMVFWVAGVADAHISGSYGGKDIQEGFIMKCAANPDDPRIAAGEILFPVVEFNETTPDYDLNGQTVCWEEDESGDKVDLNRDGVVDEKDEFVVNVEQQTLDNGLTATSQDNGDGTFKWTFTFTVANGPPEEIFLLHFVPLDPDPDTEGNQSVACIDQANWISGPASEAPRFSTCFAQVGTPPFAKAGDFEDGRVFDIDDTTVTLGKGVVFEYIVNHDPVAGTDKQVSLADGSCHSGTFNGLVPVNDKCQFSKTGKSKDAVPTRGKLSGVPHLNITVDVQPGSEQNYMSTTDDGGDGTEFGGKMVVLLTSGVVNVGLLTDLQLAETDLICEAGTFAGGIYSRYCTVDIQTLVANNSALGTAAVGAEIRLDLTADLDGTEVGGSDVVRKVLGDRKLDWRPNCNNQLASNPHGTDPIAWIGEADFDVEDSGKLNTGSVVLETYGMDGHTIIQIPLSFTGFDNVTGDSTSCSGDGYDGNADAEGINDAVFQIDITQLANSLALQNAADDDKLWFRFSGDFAQGSAQVTIQNQSQQ